MSVVALAGKDQQVVPGVVGTVAVTVIDDLAGLQRTPEVRGRELTVV